MPPADDRVARARENGDPRRSLLPRSGERLICSLRVLTTAIVLMATSSALFASPAGEPVAPTSTKRMSARDGIARASVLNCHLKVIDRSSAHTAARYAQIEAQHPR
jgi:hypothetical protein